MRFKSVLCRRRTRRVRGPVANGVLLCILDGCERPVVTTRIQCKEGVA